VPFPSSLPPGYEYFDDEPAFDAARHLQLEAPSSITSLEDLGYPASEIERKATPVAVTAPFRVLSSEGAATLLHACRRLKEFNGPADERIERATRGGVYRSRFLRDLCLSPALSAHMSSIYGVQVNPHPMGLQLGHVNYEPTELSRAVDKWHHDTLPLDFVMMVTDPATITGGQLEWFHGTKQEAAALTADGNPLPRDRVVQPHFGGGGYAVALHGDMVVHRGAALEQPGERITMVNGYVGADTSTDEQSRTRELMTVDDPNILYAEWAKFAAWRSAGRLHSLIDTMPFGTDAHEAADALERALEDAREAINQMRNPPPSSIQHYEAPATDAVPGT